MVFRRPSSDLTKKQKKRQLSLLTVHRHFSRQRVRLLCGAFIIYIILASFIPSRPHRQLKDAVRYTNLELGRVDEAIGKEELIPKRLVFTYKWNLLERKEPGHLYDNVVHTVEGYKASWKGFEPEVVMLDNDDCRKIIDRAAPFLMEHFEKEEKGSYKADMCRLATLYESGGYYFDVDMELVEPFVAPLGVDFVTVVEGESTYFFQSFLATSPKHPVIERALHVVQEYYEKDRYSTWPQKTWMGPYTLKHAFDDCYRAATERLTNVYLLKELKLSPGVYDNLERRKGNGCCCNFVVQDQDQKQPYFYSRIVGSGGHCDFPTYGPVGLLSRLIFD